MDFYLDIKINVEKILPTNNDAVSRVLQQWQRERPDLDLTPMGPIGRLKRCSALIHKRLDNTFGQFGLNTWEFDVLATLRRAGSPYCLPPTQLFSTLMITSGTMTHRLKGLEQRGLIERRDNPEDARSKLVLLSEEGLSVIDSALPAHLENERQLLAGLDPQQLELLDEQLSQLLLTLEQ